MRIESFTAENFRNLPHVSFEPHPRFNVFEGKNGQGKTNLLEAIYLIAHFKSFRESASADLIRFSHERASLVSRVTHREITREIAIQIEAKGRRIRLDGKAPERLSSALGHVAVVFFGPDDLALTKGGPKHRRSFLDRAIVNLWPGYFDEAKRYAQALRNRNKLLKQEAVDPGMMEAFDAQFTSAAARVIWRRQSFVHTFGPVFVQTLSQVSDGELEGVLTYSANKLEGDEASILAGFSEELSRKRRRDLQLGYTSAGPHAHDLECALNGHPLRRVASQGQHRAFVLALRIAQMQQIREEKGYDPILLLDDVSSELDEARNRQLMQTLHDAAGQVFITTTDKGWIQVGEQVQHYRVHDGAIV